MTTLSTPAKLLQQLDLHRKWLEEQEEGVRLVAEGENFSEVRLSKVDLRAAQLARSLFLEAELPGSSLHMADLTECDFRRALLTGADLSGARFDRTVFMGAFLNAVILSDSTMTAVNLSYTEMREAMLQGAKFRQCAFTQANLSQVSAQQAQWTECDLTDANLTDANLFRATLIASVCSYENRDELPCGRGPLAARNRGSNTCRARIFSCSPSAASKAALGPPSFRSCICCRYRIK